MFFAIIRIYNTDAIQPVTFKSYEEYEDWLYDVASTVYTSRKIDKDVYYAVVEF